MATRDQRVGTVRLTIGEATRWRRLYSLQMLKEHTMYELRISSVGSRYTLEATDLGRADARWEYDSSDDLSGKLSDLGIAPTELVIRLPPTGEPQEIVLSDRRFRGSVLADVLGK